MECDDKDEEEGYFPTVPLDGIVQSEELIPERDLCIHMPSGMSKAGYMPLTTAYLQEPVQEAVTWKEALNTLFSDMPTVFDDSDD